MEDVNLDWNRPATQEELDQASEEFLESAREAKSEIEIRLARGTRPFCWTSAEPAWLSVFDFENYADIPIPKRPGRRNIRLALPGGGQIRITIRYRHHKDIPGVDDSPGLTGKELDEAIGLCASSPDIVVTSHDGDVVHRWQVRVESICSEMNADVLVFPAATPQAVVDRVARTFHAVTAGAKHMPVKDNFFAVLDGSEGCAICGKKLSDEISKLVGVGPDCSRKYDGRPHSLALASEWLALRHKLLEQT